MVCKRGTEPPKSADYYRDQLLCKGTSLQVIQSLIVLPILCHLFQTYIYYSLRF